jgi:hypothetical protein
MVEQQLHHRNVTVTGGAVKRRYTVEIDHVRRAAFCQQLLCRREIPGLGDVMNLERALKVPIRIRSLAAAGAQD